MQRAHTLALLLIFGLLAVLFFRKPNRIVYVDSARLLNQYQGMIDARKAYELQARKWQSNIDTLTNDVRKAIRDYERTIATGSPREKDLARQLIQTRQKQLADYQQAIQQKAEQEEGKGNEAVLKVVNSFLKDYGQKHHYDLILVANQTGNIAYAADGLDVTDEVVKELNQSFKK